VPQDQPTAPADLAPQSADGEQHCTAERKSYFGGGTYGCLAVSGHAGDHVPYPVTEEAWPQDPAAAEQKRLDALESQLGPSVTPAAGCGCPSADGKTYHQQETCTDPVVAALGWYAGPKPGPTAEQDGTGTTGRDEITPATAAGRNYSCPDCGAVASYVAHEERCHRYYVAKFRAALVVDKLRKAVADSEAAWTAYSPVSPSAPGWREKREAWIGAAQDASLRAADLLAELDRQAGA
jgi:hypothetical protein